MRWNTSWLLRCLFAGILVSACVTQPDTETEILNNSGSTFAINLPTPHLPGWVVQASIYEVNIRQYTSEGTINAFAKHLPRLKDMGVNIIWLMPVFPVSLAKRKGSLGSYYATSDFKKINPEFGTKEDFEALVRQIHESGMHLILNWLPSYTGWDHLWLKQHPDWYVHDPVTDTIVQATFRASKDSDWSDVAKLNYSQPAMRKAMISDLKFWIEEMNIDGFSFDKAADVPNDFWKTCSEELRAIKPVLLLAESDIPAHRNNGYFHMNYGREFYTLMNEIADGKKNALDINTYFHKNLVRYKKGFPMMFTSNHEENNRSGTVYERMSEGHLAFAVLAATIDGMPLVYGGQEEPLRKRLSFIEKDSITFGKFAYQDFYKKLLSLKANNKALANGPSGGQLVQLATGRDESVVAYMREKGENKVLVIINLSEFQQNISLTDERCVGQYNNVFANSTVNITKEFSGILGPWDYLVLAK